MKISGESMDEWEVTKGFEEENLKLCFRHSGRQQRCGWRDKLPSAGDHSEEHCDEVCSERGDKFKSVTYVGYQCDGQSI
jgi:hypothetical protein